MKRDKEHVMAFFLSELSTDGSLDSENCLIVKGKINQSTLESILSIKVI